MVPLQLCFTLFGTKSFLFLDPESKFRAAYSGILLILSVFFAASYIFVATIKGVRFYQEKVKKQQKFVILILPLIMIGSCIHDPIHRRLIGERNEGYDDENDDINRASWFVSYSSSLQIYDSSISYHVSLSSSTIDYSL